MSNPDAICASIEVHIRSRIRNVGGAEWTPVGRVRRGDIVFALSPTPALPDIGEGGLLHTLAQHTFPDFGEGGDGEFSANLVVEVDGETHFDTEGQEYDRQRDAHLRSLGLDVLRFSGEKVVSNPDAICASMKDHIRSRIKNVGGAQWTPVGRVRRGDIVFALSPIPSLPDIGEGVTAPV